MPVFQPYRPVISSNREPNRFEPRAGAQSVSAPESKTRLLRTYSEIWTHKRSTNLFVTVVAFLSRIGDATTYFVKAHMQVHIRVNLADGGWGPDRSTWILSISSIRPCFGTLPLWYWLQCSQALQNSVMYRKSEGPIFRGFDNPRVRKSKGSIIRGIFSWSWGMVKVGD